MPFVHGGGTSCDTMVHVTTSAVLLDSVVQRRLFFHFSSVGLCASPPSRSYQLEAYPHVFLDKLGFRGWVNL